MDDWVVFVDPRKQKREQRQAKYEACPHLISPVKAQQLQSKLRIENLTITLLSPEALALQKDGWIYTRVIRPEETYETEEGWEYTMITNFNKYGDSLLFRRKMLSDGMEPIQD